MQAPPVGERPANIPGPGLQSKGACSCWRCTNHTPRTPPACACILHHMSVPLRGISAALVPGLIILGVAIAQRNALPPLRLAGNMTTIELAPVLVAANGLYRGPVTVISGGIPNLMRGEVDAATNAETQLLRQTVDDPSLRIILTEAESFYRIVARRSAGIRSVKDLRGKKIAIAPNTSAHYYLVKSLARAGVEENAVTVVPVT